MMGIKNWVQRKLGVELLDSRVSRLEELEMFTLQDVVDRLSDAMIILTNDGQRLENIRVTVPHDKKGILILGRNSVISGGIFSGQKTRTIIEPIEDEFSEL